MCRFVAYLGEPIFLEEVVCHPRHSLVHQSLQAERTSVVTNGDGFGVGWYGEPAAPAVYREVMPAWSDENLLALCATVRSGLFFAHVRAATGTAITRHNCHPFRQFQYLFMHNGQIGGYSLVRRALETRLPDVLYAARKGATDSELMFLLALARVEQGAGVVEAVLGVFHDTAEHLQRRGIEQPLRFSAALADGQTLYAFRLASDGKPPSLFVRQGEKGTVLASEPLDDRQESWHSVPAGVVIQVSDQGRRLTTVHADATHASVRARSPA